MRKDKKDFVIFLKTLKSGEKMYYYVARDEHNKRKQYSTGKTDIQEAMKVCLERMAQGRLIQNAQLSFTEYAKDFYDYEKSQFIQGKLQRGFSFSHANAEARNRFIRSTAIPFFGDKLISQISPNDIEAFIVSLKSTGIKNNTLNGKIKWLRQIFRYAYKMHDIQFDPTERIMLFKNDTAEKGIFNDEEIEQLFNNTDSLEKYWGSDIITYTMNYLSLHTGLRLGEIQALQKEDLTEDCIIVRKSWSEQYGLGSTKTGKTRIIPLSRSLYEKLAILAGNNRSGNFIFSTNDGVRPITRKTLYGRFYYALEKIGLTETERKHRNITFHSWRHTFASILANGNVPELYIRRLTGHTSQKMLDTYSHLQIDRLREAIDF